MKSIRFGTDGIRGIYGKTLTEETAFRLGAALGKKGAVLIGRDNRPSSPSLARAVACGVAASGGTCRAVGVLTTPALYYLLTISSCAYAVMVTASHNPKEYNGLKVLTANGKPNEKEQRAIEQSAASVDCCPCEKFSFAEKPDLSPYVNFVKSKIGSLAGGRVVIDFAGGAASVFKGLFREMGAEVFAINAREDGRYINDNCGALFPEVCRKKVLLLGADLGISVDGDGDRIIAVTNRGEILDGDRILYLLACRMKQKGTLLKSSVAMTVMTNGGVLKSLSQNGIRPICTAVGDTAVAEAIKSEGLNLGGEQSGHVILADLLPTGDGLLVGAALLKSILEDGPLDKTPPPDVYPQVLLNVPVKDKNIVTDPALRDAAARVRDTIPDGRLLLRASGTENLVRIMVEHPDRDVAQKAAEKLQDVITVLNER